MKLTKQKLKRLIKESMLKEMGPAFPVGMLDDIDYFKKRGLDSWKAMEVTAQKQLGYLGLTKMIMRYLNPHVDKLRLDIFWSDDQISVILSYDGHEIGETSAYDFATEAGDSFFVVSWGGTFEGKRENVKKSPRYNSIDKVFKNQGGYGPITYEAAIEYLSMQSSGLTADRNSVSDDAYDLWEYYFKNRPDVQNRLINFGENSVGFNIYNDSVISAEKWYEIKTGYHASKMSATYSDHDDIQPDMSDQQLKDQFVKYLKNESPLMRVYSKDQQPFLQAIRDLGILYINNQLILPGREIK